MSALPPFTVAETLDRRVREDGGRVYLRFGERSLTLAALGEQVNRFANGLLALGVRPGDRVAVMLPNHPDYVVAFLAMARLGVCQVPVNIKLRGPSLRYLVEHSDLRGMVVDARFAEQVRPVLRAAALRLLVVRGGRLDAPAGGEVPFDEVAASGAPTPPPVAPSPGDPLLISYTSGTTGAPKGVLVSDTMLKAAGVAAARLADVRPGDTLFLWEPLYHIGGYEVLILGLLEPVTLGLVERLSVSRFWADVQAYRATHVHYFGGVLPLLLKEAPSPADRTHGVRVVWGGGCPVSIWRAVEERFGVMVRECYGMTEASSFTTLNTEGRQGSIGRPLPYFEVRVADEAGRFLGAGERGEIWVRALEPGVITTGYFRDPAATAAALVDGWLRTGDLGHRDADGFFYYAGRKKDSVRRLGENISAWEVERVVNEHPGVAESAVIGVPNEIADEDIKVFVRLKPGHRLDPRALLEWCEPRMPAFQLPRYVAIVDEFPKTPTERIRKDLLPKGADDCIDLNRH